MHSSSWASHHQTLPSHSAQSALTGSLWNLAFFFKCLEFVDFSYEIFLYPPLVQNYSWGFLNDGLATGKPEWLSQLPGCFRWNGVPGQILICRRKGTANLAIPPFIPADSFVRDNPCNLNISMFPVSSCSYVGKIPCTKRNKIACTPRDTLEFVSKGLSLRFICIFILGSCDSCKSKRVEMDMKGGCLCAAC